VMPTLSDRIKIMFGLAMAADLPLMIALEVTVLHAGSDSAIKLTLAVFRKSRRFML